MGMYTQFIVDCKLKRETPCEIIKCLQDMINGVDNNLFTYFRNPLDNYCQTNNYPKSFDDLTLKAHGDIKNYYNDIGRFVEFIKPYVEIGLLDDSAFAKSLYETYDEWSYYYV